MKFSQFKMNCSFRLVLILLFLSVNTSLLFSQERDLSSLKLIDAVYLTVENHPDIQIQKNSAEVDHGSYLQALSTFDPNLSLNFDKWKNNTPLFGLSSGNSYYPVYYDNTSEQLGSSLSLSKKFDFGLIVTPSLSLTQTKGITNWDVNGNIGEQKDTVLNKGSMKIQFTIPLLKERFATYSRNAAKGALLKYESKLFTYQRMIATSIYRTVATYWGYLHSVRTFKNYEKSYERNTKYRDDVGKLVEANQLPKAELKQLNAFVFSKKTLLAGAEKTFFSTKQDLGMSMGIPYKEFLKIGEPLDTFPEILVIQDTAQYIEELIRIAFKNRKDYLSLLKELESARIYLKAYKNTMEPDMNFTIDMGYNGLDAGDDAGYFNALNANTPGLNVNMNLQFAFPVCNRNARGVVMKQSASISILELQKKEMEREIRSDIAIAISNLLLSQMELQSARNSVDLYQTTLDNQFLKLKLGEATLLDLNDTEEDLTNAFNNTIGAATQYASAILEIRYLTGTLTRFEGEGSVNINLEDLITLPEINQ